MSLNSLGLNKAQVEKEIASLNILLSNYQTYYQNLRGCLLYTSDAADE